MNIDFTDAEMKAVARFLEPFSDLEVELMSAWLKLVRAQAQQVTAPALGPTTAGAVNHDGDWGFR